MGLGADPGFGCQGILRDWGSFCVLLHINDKELKPMIRKPPHPQNKAGQGREPTTPTVRAGGLVSRGGEKPCKLRAATPKPGSTELSTGILETFKVSVICSLV